MKYTRILYWLVLLLVVVLSLCGCRSVAIYGNREYTEQETYTEYQRIPYTTIEPKQVTVLIDPIIPNDNLVIALINVLDASDLIMDQINDSLLLGFQSEATSNTKNITYVSRAELMGNFSDELLDKLSYKIKDQLHKEFGINIICTGTMLPEDNLGNKVLLVEIFDLENETTSIDIFEGKNWKEVGSQIAKSFYGTRTYTKTGYDEVTRYSQTSVTKTRPVVKYKREIVGKKNEFSLDYIDFHLYFTDLGLLLYFMDDLQVGISGALKFTIGNENYESDTQIKLGTKLGLGFWGEPGYDPDAEAYLAIGPEISYPFWSDADLAASISYINIAHTSLAIPDLTGFEVVVSFFSNEKNSTGVGISFSKLFGMKNPAYQTSRLSIFMKGTIL